MLQPVFARLPAWMIMKNKRSRKVRAEIRIAAIGF
jgi:hypothetical protein